MTQSAEEPLAAEQNGHQADNGVTEETPMRDQPLLEGSSDGDEGERPVREKLKKTSIAGLKQVSSARAEHQHGGTPPEPPTHELIELDGSTGTTTRGRPAKKRSFDDLQNEGSGSLENGGAGPTTNKPKLHKRMRSRDVTSSEEYTPHDRLRNGPTGTVEEESDVDAQHAPGGPGVLVDVPSRAGHTEAATKLDEEMVLPGNEGATDAAASEKIETHNTLVNDAPQKGETTDAADLPEVPAGEHKNLDKTDKEESATSAVPLGSPTTKPVSGFANTSSASPFGSLNAAKSPAQAAEKPEKEINPISGSAFASSSLAAFASSEKSPFGVVGAKSPNSVGFGGATTGGGFGGASVGAGFGSSATGFGGASPFAATATSGFGSLGGGFGTATGFGGGFGSASKPLGGLSGFGGGSSTTTTFGGGDVRKQKAFGAPEDDDDDDEDGDEEGAGDDDHENDGDDEGGRKTAKENHKLTEQQLTSGEEDEETLFTCRAKLYIFEDRQWKERGTGMLKINAKRPDEDSFIATTKEHNDDERENGDRDERSMVSRKPRLIMRTEHVHRLVLNSPIFKEMEVGDHGKEPTGRGLAFQGFNDGKPALFQVKIGKEDVARDLYHRIQELRVDL